MKQYLITIIYILLLGVETDNSISEYNAGHLIADVEDNNRQETKLGNIAIKHIKENHSQWITGKIRGKPVRTRNNIRVYFSKNDNTP